MTGHVLVVECLRPVMTSNEQRAWHWTKQRNAVKAMHLQILDALSARPIATQTAPIGIRVTWYPPNRVRRDHDALNPFLKAAQDALVHAGVIEDDDARYVAWGTTVIGPVDRNHPRIEVHITPAAWCWVCDRDRPPPDECGPHCQPTQPQEKP